MASVRVRPPDTSRCVVRPLCTVDAMALARWPGPLNDCERLLTARAFLSLLGSVIPRRQCGGDWVRPVSFSRSSLCVECWSYVKHVKKAKPLEASRALCRN